MKRRIIVLGILAACVGLGALAGNNVARFQAMMPTTTTTTTTIPGPQNLVVNGTFIPPQDPWEGDGTILDNTYIISDSDDLAQTINGIVAGHTYRLTFTHGKSGEGIVDLSVRFGATIIGNSMPQGVNVIEFVPDMYTTRLRFGTYSMGALSIISVVSLYDITP